MFSISRFLVLVLCAISFIFHHSGDLMAESSMAWPASQDEHKVQLLKFELKKENGQYFTLYSGTEYLNTMGVGKSSFASILKSSYPPEGTYTGYRMTIGGFKIKANFNVFGDPTTRYTTNQTITMGSYWPLSTLAGDYGTLTILSPGGKLVEEHDLIEPLVADGTSDIALSWVYFRTRNVWYEYEGVADGDELNRVTWVQEDELLRTIVTGRHSTTVFFPIYVDTADPLDYGKSNAVSLILDADGKLLGGFCNRPGNKSTNCSHMLSGSTISDIQNFGKEASFNLHYEEAEGNGSYTLTGQYNCDTFFLNNLTLTPNDGAPIYFNEAGGDVLETNSDAVQCFYDRTVQLEGAWTLHWYDIDSSGNKSYAQGEVVINRSGVVTGGSYLFQNGQSGTITEGFLSLSKNYEFSGALTNSEGNTLTVEAGRMNSMKNAITFLASSTSGAHDLGMLVKKTAFQFDTPSVFNTTWIVQFINVDKDGKTDLAFGDIEIGNTPGLVTGGSVTFVDGPTLGITGGSLQVDTEGIVSGTVTHDGGNTITIEGGKVNQGSSLAPFVQTSTSGAMGFGVMMQYFDTEVHTTSELEGSWTLTLHNTASSEASGWAHGSFDIDNSGNISSGAITFLDGTTVSVTTGALGLNASGRLSGSLTHTGGETITIVDGKFDRTKEIISFIDTTSSGASEFGFLVKGPVDIF